MVLSLSGDHGGPLKKAMGFNGGGRVYDTKIEVEGKVLGYIYLITGLFYLVIVQLLSRMPDPKHRQLANWPL